MTEMNIFERLDHMAHANALMFDDLDTIEAVKSRLTTAEAERDLAIARAEAYKTMLAWAESDVIDTERRGTAAIVAWLRGIDCCNESRSYGEAFADAIAGGDRLK